MKVDKNSKQILRTKSYSKLNILKKDEFIQYTIRLT